MDHRNQFEVIADVLDDRRKARDVLDALEAAGWRVIRNPLSALEADAHKHAAGVRAARDGKPDTACPYVAGGSAFNSWMRGYRSIQKA